MKARNLLSEARTQMNHSYSHTVNLAMTMTTRAIIACAVLLWAILLHVQPAIAQSTPLPGNEPALPSSPLPGTESAPTSCPNGGGAGCTADPGSAPGGNLPDNDLGNPINLMSGNKHQSELDFEIPGAALSLRRMYNSGDSDSNRGLGQGWSHSYSVSLLDAGNGNLQIAQSDGGRINFYPDGTDENGYPLLRARQSNHGYVTYDNERYYWRLGDGRTLTFNGQFLVHIDWPDQRELKLYYRQKRLSTVTDETGRVLTFAYTGGSRAEALPSFEESRFGTAEGYLESVTLPDNSVIAYDYDNKRNLTRVRFPDGTDREYHYENDIWPNHLTGLTDRTGVRFASWTYDDEGRANSSEHANGVEKVTLVFPDTKAVADGQIVQTQVTNSLGYTSTYTWQQEDIAAIPRLLSSEGAGCTTCPETGYEYTYDEQGRLLSRANVGQGNGTGKNLVNYAYDNQGRISSTHSIESTGYERLIERREYSQNSILPKRIVRPSVNPGADHSFDIELDKTGKVLSITEKGYAPNADSYLPIERTTSFTYEQDQLIAIDGPRSDVDDVTWFEWDSHHRLSAIKAPLSPILRINAYDAFGRPSDVQIGSRSPYKIEFGEAAEIVRVMQRGQTLSYDYDAERRVIAVTDPDGRRTSTTYDDAGRVISITDDLGRVSRVADGSVVGSLTTLSKTQQHQPAELNNESDSGTGVQFDMASRLATVLESGTSRSFGFDLLGRPDRFVDARTNQTSYPRDDFGRVVLLESPDTGSAWLKYDAADNRTERRMSDGSTSRFVSDAAGRLVKRIDLSVEGISKISTWRYDEISGELAETGNDSGSEQYVHDVEGQLIEHKRLIDGLSFSTRYVYDRRGRPTLKTLPDGNKLHFSYHEAGPNRGSLRAITRSSLAGLSMETIVGEIDLDSRDGAEGFVSWGGSGSVRRYSSKGEIEQVSVEGKLDLKYTTNRLGQIVKIEDDGIEEQFGYEDGRLVLANMRSGNYAYTYDAEGNRLTSETTSLSGLAEFERYTYMEKGSGNRLIKHQIAPAESLLNIGFGSTADVTALPKQSYDYGVGGAASRIGSLSYTYDADQRITEVYRNAALVARYSYNTFGERIKKVTYRGADKSSVVTYYLYDGTSLSAEANQSGEIIAQYVYLTGGRPVSKLVGQETYAIHTDHLGTPRLMSDSEGQEVWSAVYDPFGKAEIEREDVSLNLRLPGQYYDAETDVHYNYQRYYDPNTGRYLTPDPIGLNGGLNLYAYVDSDPIGSSDRLGLAVDPDNRVSRPWIFGTLVHTLFSGYIAQLGISNGMVGDLFGTGPNNGPLKPDAWAIGDDGIGSIWELKPSSWQSGPNYVAAQAQVGAYVANANANNTTPGRFWSTGACAAITGGPAASVPIGTIPFDGSLYEITIHGDPSNPNSGLIFYDFVRLGPAVPGAVPVLAPLPEREATVTEWRYWEETTGLTGAALVLFLLIWQGSRIIPPRNLVPI